MDKEEKSLYQALLSLQTEEECFRFFRDICTPSEVQSLKERWRIAQMLDNKEGSYRQLHEKTGVSIVTIGRVARFLNQESYQGYRLLLDRLKNKKIKL